MPGLEINTPSADRFSQLLGKYLELNKRNAGELVAKKAKDVAIQLYRATAKNAPSRQEIATKVKAQGWRVKRKAGAWPLKAGEKKGSTGPLHRMQASVIGRRQKAIGTAASGWLPAVNKFGGSAGKRLVQVKNPRGTVTIEGMGTGSPKITIANQTPGIAYMQKKFNLTRTAFNAASKDMVPYIRKKLDETAQSLKH